MKQRKSIDFDCETSNQINFHNCTAFDSNQPKFDSPECESRFRRALRGVPSKAHIRRENSKAVLCLRPENLLQFGAAVNREGLEQCRATRKILQYLDKNKEEFLKFEHSQSL